MTAHIEHPCHRERRSLSRRVDMEKKSPNVSGRFGPARSWARMHATAKKPATINSMRIVFASMGDSQRGGARRAQGGPKRAADSTHQAGWNRAQQRQLPM